MTHSLVLIVSITVSYLFGDLTHQSSLPVAMVETYSTSTPLTVNSEKMTSKKDFPPRSSTTGKFDSYSLELYAVFT